MKEEISLYRKRIKSLQMTVMIIMVFVLVIGGCVFGLGVKIRPVLRITRKDAFDHVKWILDLMVAAGIAQLGTAGLNCFAACWKLIWPLYLAIGLTAITVFVEFGAIGTSLHLLHFADDFANEDIVHPWYWVECQQTDSCHSAMLSYIYYFIMPQIGLSAIAVFLQCLGVLNLSRIVKTISEHKRTMANYKECYKESLDAPDKPGVEKPLGTVSQGIEVTPMKKEESGDENEETNSQPPLSEDDALDKLSILNPNFHSPSSILKTDHGYVPASGGSIDHLETSQMEMRNRKERLTGSPSITFSTDVQVHYYDTKAEIEKSPEEQSPEVIELNESFD